MEVVAAWAALAVRGLPSGARIVLHNYSQPWIDAVQRQDLRLVLSRSKKELGMELSGIFVLEKP